MRWVKLVTSLRRNPIFRHASPGAKFVFYSAIEMAGDFEQAGALATRLGPMTVQLIADEVNLTPAQTKKALDELVERQLLFVRLDGAYVIARFSEKTDAFAGPMPSSRDRVRKFRDKVRLGDGPVTLPETLHGGFRNSVEVEVDIEPPIPPSGGPVHKSTGETTEKPLDHDEQRRQLAEARQRVEAMNERFKADATRRSVAKGGAK